MKYVYMLREGENNYKIGIANNIRKRLSAIQTSHHNKIELVTARLFDNAGEVEKQLHSLLNEQKGGGGREWFTLSEHEAFELVIKIHNIKQPDIDPRIESISLIHEVLEQNKRIEKKLNTLSYSPKHSTNKNTHEKTLNDYANEAYQIITRTGRASTSHLQVQMGIGYGKAARIITLLEREGLIGPPNGSHPRTII